MTFGGCSSLVTIYADSTWALLRAGFLGRRRFTIAARSWAATVRRILLVGRLKEDGAQLARYLDVHLGNLVVSPLDVGEVQELGHFA